MVAMRLHRLDGTSRNHLVTQVLLVLANGAVPAGEGLVLANHDVLGDLVEEPGSGVLVICFQYVWGQKLGVKTYLKS